MPPLKGRLRLRLFSSSSFKANNTPAFCKIYEEKIDAYGGLDLQLLGIGSNGHIGFNEPGSLMNSPTRLMMLDHSTRVAAIRDFGRNLSHVPKKAITLGVNKILQAKEKFLELNPSDIVSVKSARVANDIHVTGTLAPVRQTILNARVAGEIKAIAVREGQSVSAGQVLLAQDDRDLNARLQQAQASLATAKAEAALVIQNLERIKPLQQKEYASATELANAEKQVDIRQAQVKSAEVSVQQARQQQFFPNQQHRQG